MSIAVVDYKAGNLTSVCNALTHIGADHFVSSDPDKLRLGDRLIFPGVGHAKSAMARLKETGIADMLTSYANSGKAMLGICLGSQVLLDHSEEGDTDTLGIILGQVKLFSPSIGLKIPHIGWNQVYPAGNPHPLFKDIPDGSSFYFVHSYYTAVADASNTLCTTDYGGTFCSGVRQGNVCAVQFHPEKSGKWGLKMLENFSRM
ncbi:MAG: imidazole glycerol phosphate synthase subunit HisH [Deferribacteraceae bacterium]|jgi:glutamine amidotransferase|nr:imidazole glycerol phosphate synthase subunit HisH [Deferribacteraceae bacterium]